MIQFRVECRVLTPKLKTMLKNIKVTARDSNEAKAKARQHYRRTGHHNVEALAVIAL